MILTEGIIDTRQKLLLQRVLRALNQNIRALKEPVRRERTYKWEEDP